MSFSSDPARPVGVIANPEAASGRGARTIPRLRRLLERRGRPFRIEETRGPGHARELAAEARHAGDASALVIVGGDGTIHEAANGVLDAEGAPSLPLLVLPVGTGNDFHRMLCARGRLAEVEGLLDHGVVRTFDVGLARWEGGEERFVNLLGVGIDVEVLRRRAGFRRLSGLPQYLAALLVALVRYRPFGMRMDFTGAQGANGRFETDVLLAAVTVGPSVGGGFRLSPQARPDDGELDLFVVEPLGPLEVARHLPRVLRGTHRETKRIHMRTLRSARIVSTDRQPFTFELDGELMRPATSWLELEILPGALPVLDLPPAGSVPG